jgi:ribosomal protein S4
MKRFKFKKILNFSNICGIKKIQLFKHRKWRNKWITRIRRRIVGYKLRKFYVMRLARRWLKRHKKKTFRSNLISKRALNEFYGFLSLKQLKKILINAESLDLQLQSYQKFHGLLESRLSTVVYRMGYVKSIKVARQWIKHGFFHLNDIKIYDSNIRLFPGDVISLNPKKELDRKIFVRLKKIPTKAKYFSCSPFELNSISGCGILISHLIPFNIPRIAARRMKIKSVIKHVRGF